MKIFIAAFVLVFVATIQIGYSSKTEQWQKKIGSSIRLLNTTAPIDVLVLLKERADLSLIDRMQVSHPLTKAEKGTFVFNSLREVADRSQKELLQTLQDRRLEVKSFYILNALAVRKASPEIIEELARRDDVRKIILDPVVRQKQIVGRVSGLPAGDVRGVGENIASTGADKVWKLGFKGEGIVVAGQDTGVAWQHPALIKHYRGNTRGGTNHDNNWHDSIRESISGGKNTCGLNLQAPCDDYGHGTHTMGSMIGDDGGDNQIGMAPDAKWIACRNMESGYGRPSSYIECYEWFLAPYPLGGSSKAGDPTQAPHVINNSWGCPKSEGCEGSEIKPVIEAIYKAGIMNVVSAGNDGPGCGTILDQPASVSDFTLSVGAHNHRTKLIAGFSSRGPSSLDGKQGPDITAPGVSVRSSVPSGGYEDAMWSGTSMAGPHVAGAVALLWSAQPKLVGNIDQTVEILRSTAAKMTTSETCGGVAGSAVPNNTYGYGELNVEAAVKKALSL